MKTVVINSRKPGRYLGCLVTCQGGRYEVVICPTVDNSVQRPENMERYFDPQGPDQNPGQHPAHPYQIVVPIQPGACCTANCRFCNYGTKRPTPYASPDVMVSLIETGVQLAMEQGIIKGPEQAKFSLLKGGEISLHPRFEQVLAAIYGRFPSIPVKISSIGVKNLAFLERIIEYRRCHPEHRICLQISVNATDESQRAWLVNKPSSNAIRLYSLPELAEHARNWRRISHRRLTATFTLMKNSICSADKLINSFNPDNVVFRLRRMHPHTHTAYDVYPITREDYEKLYLRLYRAGFTVIIGNPSYDEIEHHLLQGWAQEHND